MFRHPLQVTEYGVTERERPILICGESMTKQSHKDETDINLIMRKYQKTGLVSFVNERQPQYMEAPEIDFQTAMQIVTQANEMFADMPSSMRKRFHNDPGEFMEFVHNPDNAEEMVKLGLASPPTLPEPSLASVLSEALQAAQASPGEGEGTPPSA